LQLVSELFERWNLGHIYHSNLPALQSQYNPVDSVMHLPVNFKHSGFLNARKPGEESRVRLKDES